MAPPRLLYFGGQTLPAGQSLRRLFNTAAGSPLLREFLERSADALRLEAARAHDDDRHAMPVFRSILDLAKRCDAPDSDVVLCTVALYIVQMGEYLLRVEQDPCLLTSPHRAIVGICTGLLPALVAATSSSISDVVANGQEVLLVALRLGLEARRRAVNVEPKAESWSVAVLGDAHASIGLIEPVLAEFSSPPASRVYVSAESISSLTVSGAPSVLDRFLASPALAALKKLRLPVFAPFHAPHLPNPGPAALIAASSPLLGRRLADGTTLISCSTASPYSGATAAELLPQIVADIFEHKLLDGRAVECALVALAGGDAEPTAVDVLGPAGTNLVKRVAEQIGLRGVEVRGPETPSIPRAGSPLAGSIAVVGMAGRFPGSEDLRGFWETLREGRDVHKEVPKDRFDVDLHLDKTGRTKNSTLSAYGCFLDRPGAFDNRLFNMSPREAEQTDPCQRLLLMATYEALEMAGYQGADRRGDAERVGSFVSLTADDWREYNNAQNIDMYFVTGGLRAFAAGRLNYFFKWEGPSFTVDTACSSGAAAVQLACASLVDNDCDVAVVGGANVMTGPNLYAGLSRGGFVSPTGSSKTFDETADGYCRGEAAAVLILKRLDNALAHGDNILGVIRSVTTNHSAHAPSITQPHSPAQKSLYEEVLRKAGLEPHDIGYVEAHGTGTQAGDTKEMDSIYSTFAQGRPAENPLYVGSVKSNVGHGESVAGITSVIKSLLMFKENAIPPHAGLKTRLNHKFPPLEAANIHVARSLKPFTTPPAGTKRVLVSSFGASGGNTAIVLEEPPAKQELSGSTDPRTHHVVALSAKTQASFEGNKRRLLDYLGSHPQVRLGDLAYSTTSRRLHHPIRAAFNVSSVEQLVQKLSGQDAAPSSPSAAQRKAVFLFPGQGGRLAGIAKGLYDTCKPFRQFILEMEALAKSLGLPLFLPVLLDCDDEGKDLAAAGPVVTQLATVSLEVALARLLRLWGITPSAVIGHSLGEYAALCVAGVLSVSDTLFLVGRRAELVEKHCSPGTHGMLAVAATADQCKDLLASQGAGGCAAACFNAPRSTVISGPLAELDNFQAVINQKLPGTRCTPVPTTYAFHSSQLDPLKEPYLRLASSIRFSAPQVPVASTLLGELVSDADAFSASYLVDHARQPVQFAAALRACETAGLIDGSGLLVEVGPDTMCLSMARSTLQQPGELLPLLKPSQDSWDAVANLVSKAYVHGFPVNWVEYNKPYDAGLRLLDLSSYHFDLKDFWVTYQGGVASLQRQIDELKLALESSSMNSSAPPPATVSEPMLRSCIHSIESQTIAKSRGSMVFTADIQKQPLRDLIEGHNVVGVKLAPSSIYAEMAYVAAGELYSRLYREREPPAIELGDVAIAAPLILSPNPEPQVVKVSITMETADSTATVKISSAREHARCKVTFANGGEERWAREWSRKHYLIHDRVRKLAGADQAAGTVHRLWRDMVYKVFAPVTTYAADYWSIAAVFIQRGFREAALELELRETPKECSFSFDPCWLDGIAQAAGFMLNSDLSKPDDVLFVSTGWEAMRVRRALASGRRYHCHVRAYAASPTDDTTVLCDVTVLDDENVLAVADGLTFKRIKKAHLLSIFGQHPSSQTTTATSRAAPKPVEHRGAARVSQATRHAADPSPAAPRKSKRGRPADRPSSNTNSLLSAVLNLIAEEVGISTSEMSDDSTLESLGVDSLLTVSITTRLKAEMDVDLPAALMLGSTTISDLRGSLGGGGEGDDNASSSSQSDISGEDESGSDGSITPLPSPPTPVTPAETGAFSVAGLLTEFVNAVAEETGMDADQIDEHALLTELGVDSLMSISVLGIVQERTGTELPASLLTDCTTMAEVKKALSGLYGATEEVEVPVTAPTSVSGHPAPAPAPLPAPPKPAALDINRFHSNVVLLQGDPRSDRPRLFLISEGSGSAAAYIHLPNYSDKVTIYGLDSPFLRCPEQFDFSMEEICSRYVRGIRSIQPRGPYLIGGWSIGGNYAYETTRQLVEAGERVHGLLLIDSAAPRRLEGIPRITVDVCEETGMFLGFAKAGGKKALTPGQKMHVAGCVRAAAEYEPVPLPESGRPAHVYVIWSRFGMFDKLSLKVQEVGDRIAEEKGLEKTGVNHDWLTAERTSFGPKGWDRLVGPVECFSLDGDHFSIMMLPKIKTHTGPLLEKMLQTFVDSLRQSSGPGADSIPVLSHSAVKDTFRKLQTFRVQCDAEEGCGQFPTRVYPEQRRLVLAYVVEALEKLGCPIRSLPAGAPVTAERIPAKLAQLLDAMNEMLEDGGLITRDAAGRAFRTAQPADPTPSTALYEAIVGAFPPHAVEHQLLHVTASQLAECLTGEAKPMHLVFGLNRGLIQEFYTNAPMFASASRHLSEFLKRAYERSGARREGAPFELLEVGAGLGGTTAHVLKMLDGAGIPFRYTYTDISPSLVGAAKKRFSREGYGDRMEFVALDVTDAARLPDRLRGRFHTVLSTNCVHATPDLAASTANMRRMLRPDGFMALVELTRRLYWFDLVFGFFDGWWSFTDGRRHALTDIDFWRASLGKAGFGDVLWLDEAETGAEVNPQLIVSFNNSQA